MQWKHLSPFIERRMLERSQWARVKNLIIIVGVILRYFERVIEQYRLADHQVVWLVPGWDIESLAEIRAKEKHQATNEKQQKYVRSPICFFGSRDRCRGDCLVLLINFCD